MTKLLSIIFAMLLLASAADARPRGHRTEAQFYKWLFSSYHHSLRGCR